MLSISELFLLTLILSYRFLKEGKKLSNFEALDAERVEAYIIDKLAPSLKVKETDLGKLLDPDVLSLTCSTGVNPGGAGCG